MATEKGLEPNITEKTGFVNIFFGGGKKAVNTEKSNKQIRRPEEEAGG